MMTLDLVGVGWRFKVFLSLIVFAKASIQASLTNFTVVGGWVNDRYNSYISLRSRIFWFLLSKVRTRIYVLYIRVIIIACPKA